MAKKLLSDLQLKLGRLLGQTKRKNKDIVEMWIQLCNSNGVSTADRLLELLAWDLQNAGIDLGDIKVALKRSEIGEIRAKFDMAMAFQDLVNQFTNEVVRQKSESTQVILDLQQQIANLNSQISQLIAENTALKQMLAQTELKQQTEQVLEQIKQTQQHNVFKRGGESSQRRK